MKSIFTLLILMLSTQALAAKDVLSSTVSFVYQLDSEATVFEFQASVPNNCGSSLYQVHSPNEAVANRKFSLVLAAFTAGKKIAFHDTESCLNGNRSKVAWVRLIN